MQIYIVNPKIQYNYRNINCNPDSRLVDGYSVVVDGEFLLQWCEIKILANHKSGRSIYVAQLEHLI